MVISFYGEGCFKIQSGETVLLIDPINPSSGLIQPRFKFDIELKTLTVFPVPQSSIINSQSSIFGPGEYNIKDIDIFGIGLINESSDKFIKSVFIATIEGVKMCFLGHISEMPEADVLEKLEEIDILFIPVGGKPFIDQKLTVKLIKQINPKIVAPSFYKISGLKRPAGDLKIFLEEGGYKKLEQQEKLTIKKKDLAEIKKTEIVCLKN